MAALRLFVALVPPTAVRTELAALAAPLGGVGWTPEGNIHLTLRFIGEAGEAKTDQLAASLARVRVEPFILPTGGVGLFPTRGPARVLWAGVGPGHPRLYQLRKQVDEALLAVDSGLALPGFQAHFTIGRLDGSHAPKEIARFLEKHGRFEGPPFRVREFLLMESLPQPGRPPVYRIRRSYPLTT